MLCRDKGLPGGCPLCEKDSLASKVVANITPEILDSQAIPARYRTVEWDIEVLKANHSDLKGDALFERYCKILTNCLVKLKRGELPGKSAIIIADRGFGKRTFAYSCMKECIKHGFSVQPIIDTSQYKRLIALSSDRPLSHKPGDLPFTMESVTSCDLLFMSVDVANFRTALRTIEAVCDRRARVGKPTFITSRFSLPAMATLDYFGDPMGVINRGTEVDSFKFPYLIQYIRGFKNGD